MNHHLRKELERRVKTSEYSMKGLSKAIGHGETLVRDIITGRTKNPSEAIVGQIAEKLGCTVVDLFGYDPKVKAAEEAAEAAKEAAKEAAVSNVTELKQAEDKAVAPEQQEEIALGKGESKVAAASGYTPKVKSLYQDISVKHAPLEPIATPRAANQGESAKPAAANAPSKNLYKPEDPFVRKETVSFVNKFAPFISFLLVIAGVFLLLTGYEPSIDTFITQGRTFPGSGPKFDPYYTSVGFGVLFAAYFIYEARVRK